MQLFVKSVILLAIRSGYSALGENCGYLSYKYELPPSSWISHYVKFINDYVSDCIVTPYNNYFMRELCMCRVSGDVSILTSTEMSQLLEYICTI